MENMTLNPKEQARLQVLNSLLDEHMTLDQAATLMGVTTRHTRRILAAYRDEGAAVRAWATTHSIAQRLSRRLSLARCAVRVLPEELLRTASDTR